MIAVLSVVGVAQLPMTPSAVDESVQGRLLPTLNITAAPVAWQAPAGDGAFTGPASDADYTVLTGLIRPAPLGETPPELPQLPPPTIRAIPPPAPPPPTKQPPPPPPPQKELPPQQDGPPAQQGGPSGQQEGPSAEPPVQPDEPPAAPPPRGHVQLAP